MSYLEKRRLVQTAQLFTFCISFLAAVSGSGCRSSQPPENSQRESGTVISTIPPFSTREPERYQAMRIVTFSAWSADDATPQEIISRVLIARAGERRREEYVDDATVRVVYLDIPTGQFVLLPSGGLYADLTETSNQAGSGNELSELSPSLLLNEKSGAVYENLGSVMLNGRMTTKYRVTSGHGNSETVAKSEALIWIDESIGLPVRSETISSAAEHSSKVIVELNDIKLEADELLFALPANYRKVAAGLILDRIHAAK